MQCVVSILSTFVFLRTSCSPADAAESPPTYPDPCANYRCGPPEGAICEVSGNNYKCTCKEGWQHALSGVCIPEGPCGRYPCGPYSDRCLWSGGDEYTCKCKTGYGINKLTHPTCVEVNGDCGNNPCGVRGVCMPTSDGEHSCECANGYTPAPSPAGITCKSEQKVGCQPQSCGAENIGKCVETESSYFCICRENSMPHFNHDAEATCQASENYDFCHPNACGENGTSCTFVGNYRVCTCGLGYAPKSVNLWGDQRCYEAEESPQQPESSHQPPTKDGQPPHGGGGVPPNGQQPKQGFKVSTRVLIAGGLVGVLLLILVAGGIAASRHFKKSKGAQALDQQRSVDFEGREGIPAGSQEADVLIKARNEDWAH